VVLRVREAHETKIFDIVSLAAIGWLDGRATRRRRTEIAPTSDAAPKRAVGAVKLWTFAHSDYGFFLNLLRYLHGKRVQAVFSCADGKGGGPSFVMV
jgi:hypothetical protein